MRPRILRVSFAWHVSMSTCGSGGMHVPALHLALAWRCALRRRKRTRTAPPASRTFCFALRTTCTRHVH
jgi:hypothetical protein